MVVLEGKSARAISAKPWRRWWARRRRGLSADDHAAEVGLGEGVRRVEQRSLEGKNYVYLWVDGVHFNIRLEEDRQCILVVLGATADGKKELIAVADGYRESEQSWKSLLLDVKARGLIVDPKLATGDGALGFWKACRKFFRRRGSNAAGCTRRPTCWTNCRSVCRPKAKAEAPRRSGWPTRGRTPIRRSTCSWTPTGEVPEGDGLPGQRIATCC